MIPHLPLHSAGRIGLNVLLLLAGVVALRLGESVFVPMLIALLLASVLGPTAYWLHQTLKIRWSLACITVITGLLVLVSLITFVFSFTVSRMAATLPAPNEPTKWIEQYNKFRVKLEKISPWPLDQETFPVNPEKVDQIRIFQYLSESAPRIVQEVARFTANWLWQCILIMFILFFVLLEGRVLARRVVEIFGPSAEVQDKATGVLYDMAKQVRTYLVWRTIINFGLAIVMGVIYQMAGLSQPWAWAVLLSIMNYIPYLGPVIAGVPPFIDAFLSAEHPATAVVVTVVYLIVIVLEGYLIVPLLMGRNMDLNATTVMLACLFWELVWGMTGLFLAMPIMAGIKAILHHVPEWRPWANLMSSPDDEEEARSLLPTAESVNGKLEGSHIEPKLPLEAEIKSPRTETGAP